MSEDTTGSADAGAGGDARRGRRGSGGAEARRARRTSRGGGMSMPFILSRFRLDPATASAPLIASIADIMGVVIYFSIARAILFH